MQKHSTKKNAKRSTNHHPSVSLARKVLGVEPTKADHDTAKLILTLYHNKSAPEMFKRAIFQLFWDLHLFYGFHLPNKFTSKWRPYWPPLLARVRQDGYLPTSISYTWQPTPEREAELDEEERIENEAEAVFNYLRTVESYNEHTGDVLSDLIDQFAHPYNVREMFIHAWPLILQGLEKEKAEGSASDETSD